MAREVKVGFKADTKQAEQATENLGKKLSLQDQVKKATAGFADLAGALTIVGKGFEQVKRAFDETVNATVSYDKTVRDLASNLSITTEEASKMIQVADDYGVSMERVSTALEMAAKNGFAPTIDNLAALADEINAIKDPTEKAARASEIFGRGWGDINPILAEGGDKIRELADGIDEDLIRTEEQVRASRELEIALDDWNDSVTALKTNIGTGLIPSVTAFLDLLNSPDADQAAGFINTVFKGTFLESPASKEARALEEQVRKTINAVSGLKGGFVGYSAVLTQSPGAIQTTIDFKDQLGALNLAIRGDVGKAIEDFTEKNEALKQKSAELIEKIGILESKRWLNQAQKKELEEMREELSKNEGAIDALAEKHEEAKNRIILSYLEQKLAAEGWSKESIEFYTRVAREMGLIDDATVLALQGVDEAWRSFAEDGNINLAITRIYDVQGALRSLPTDIMINVGFNVQQFPGVPGYSGGQGGGGENIIPFESGGSFVVPPGYPNDSYPLGPGARASSGEMITVSPTFNITQQPGQSGEALAQVVNKSLADTIRRARRGGAQYAGRT